MLSPPRVKLHCLNMPRPNQWLDMGMDRKGRMSEIDRLDLDSNLKFGKMTLESEGGYPEESNNI